METRRTLFMKIAAALGLALLPFKKLCARSVPRFTEDDYKKALSFIEGNQWPPEVQAMREAAGRPCIVINRLSYLVQEVAAKRGFAVGSPNYKALVVDLYRKLADSQRLLNLYQSNIAELLHTPGVNVAQEPLPTLLRESAKLGAELAV